MACAQSPTVRSDLTRRFFLAISWLWRGLRFTRAVEMARTRKQRKSTGTANQGAEPDEAQPKEIPEDIQVQLRAVGHEADNYNLASMQLRSATDAQLCILKKRVVRTTHKTSGKNKFFCLRCHWSSEGAGLSRPLEHVIHYSQPVADKVATYLTKQGLEFVESKQQALQLYRAKGSRTSACSTADPISPEDLRILADQGVHAAQLWRELLQSAEAQQMLGGRQVCAAEPADLKELQRLHSLAVVHSHQSFNSVEGEVMKLFFTKLSPEYKPPTRTHVREVVDASADTVADALHKQMCTDGPWCLVTDGATIAGCGFLNIGAMAASGR